MACVECVRGVGCVGLRGGEGTSGNARKILPRVRCKLSKSAPTYIAQ